MPFCLRSGNSGFVEGLDNRLDDTEDNQPYGLTKIVFEATLEGSSDGVSFFEINRLRHDAKKLGIF